MGIIYNGWKSIAKHIFGVQRNFIPKHPPKNGKIHSYKESAQKPSDFTLRVYLFTKQKDFKMSNLFYLD